jgi:hypothetical protein
VARLKIKLEIRSVKWLKIRLGKFLLGIRSKRRDKVRDNIRGIVRVNII